MALVIEFGSKGFPTSFGRLLRSTQAPFAVETKCFPGRSRSSSGVVSGAIRQLAACARRLPRSTQTGNNEASNRKRRDRSSPTVARRKIGNLIRKQIEQLLPTMHIEFLIDMLHVACHRVFRKHQRIANIRLRTASSQIAEHFCLARRKPTFGGYARNHSIEILFLRQQSIALDLKSMKCPLERC